MNDIERLRKNVDELDEKILELIEQRMNLVREIYKKKENEGKPVEDKKREEELKRIWLEKAEKLGINNESLIKILNEILKISKQTQQNG